MKKKIWIIAITVTTLLSSTILINKFGIVKAASTSVSLSDIKGHWAETAISDAVQKGYIDGYPDGSFNPNGKITRAEYAALLSRVTNLKPSSTQEAFSDLKGNWSREAVNKLAGLGFIDPSDYPNGFQSDVQLTRYEMMKWISAGLAKSDSSFQQALSDTKNTLLPTPETYKGGISSEQVPFIALVKGTGIIEGFEDGSFRPDDTTTRAEVTTILLRYANVEGKKADQYKALNELREVGTTGTNVTSLTPYFYTRNLKGLTPNFSNILDKQITLKNNSGSVKFSYFIVVDSEGDQGGGVYAPMFLDKLAKWQKGQYCVFSDISITSNMDTTDLNTMANGIYSNRLISFQRLTGSKVNDYGLNTIPEMNAWSYLVKGEEKRVWVQSVIDKTRSASFSLTADNGDDVRIGLKK
ncbi:hypothetical protein GCM10008018_72450 [Paenibacillus marchantiophytorum]|uniref:SLH domain-containing protein n=1 Tax=Paenibacillus marchantiophytorum TaxID=1619310 RepID=A0ABQ1FJG4_9BACL|nr:S-layer homology domain-containing protein [Paenibacillus marchantiophytorum]GGA17867.1 hypothetical protein GCM10008018_72450 [Paenibacillus marchantiophytorum]